MRAFPSFLRHAQQAVRSGVTAGTPALRTASTSSPTACLATAAAPGRHHHHRQAPPAAASSAPTPPPPPHIPVLLEEVVAAFAGMRLGVYLDGTLGAGGHASALAAAHPEMHTLIGLDVDPVARATATARLAGLAEERRRKSASGGEGASPDLALHIRAANFRTLAAEVAAVGCGPVDGILLDLGFSSMQIDDPTRGFALSKDGPLDMRMSDPAHPLGAIPASEIVNSWPEGDLAALLWEAGEERAAKSIAARLVAARAVAPITTTGELVAAMGLAGWRKRGGGGGGRGGGKGAAGGIHPATRVFQALRIGANDELGALAAALPAALDALAPGGRCAIISFHSLEDRAVKRAFLKAAGKGGGEEEASASASAFAGGRWERAARAAWGDAPPAREADPTVRIITRRPLTASPEELAANPRARSAKLRVVEKL